MGAEDEGGKGMVGEDITHKERCPTDFTNLHGWLSHRFRRFARISTCLCVDFTEENRRFHRFMQMRFSLFHTEVTDILLELHVYQHEQPA